LIDHFVIYGPLKLIGVKKTLCTSSVAGGAWKAPNGGTFCPSESVSYTLYRHQQENIVETVRQTHDHFGLIL
jgi:hypothetical protein